MHKQVGDLYSPIWSLLHSLTISRSQIVGMLTHGLELLHSIGIYFQCIFLPFYVSIPYMIQIVWLTETVVGSKLGCFWSTAINNT